MSSPNVRAGKCCPLAEETQRPPDSEVQYNRKTSNRTKQQTSFTWHNVPKHEKVKSLTKKLFQTQCSFGHWATCGRARHQFLKPIMSITEQAQPHRQAKLTAQEHVVSSAQKTAGGKATDNFHPLVHIIVCKHPTAKARLSRTYVSAQPQGSHCSWPTKFHDFSRFSKLFSRYISPPFCRLFLK